MVAPAFQHSERVSVYCFVSVSQQIAYQALALLLCDLYLDTKITPRHRLLCCPDLQIMLYTVFPAVALGPRLMWLRLRHMSRLAKSLHNSFNMCKAVVLSNTFDEQTRTSGSVVALMGDLKKVHRWRDVRQVRP